MKPYVDIDNLRIINHTTPQSELVWHRDREDRSVTIVEGNDWLLQMEDELPIRLNISQTYFIPKMTYHRVIRGTSTLKIEITKSLE